MTLVNLMRYNYKVDLKSKSFLNQASVLWQLLTSNDVWNVAIVLPIKAESKSALVVVRRKKKRCFYMRMLYECEMKRREVYHPAT